MLVTQNWEGETRRSQEFTALPCLAKMVSFWLSVRPFLKAVSWQKTLTSSSVFACMWRCIHSLIIMDTHVCIHHIRHIHHTPLHAHTEKKNVLKSRRKNKEAFTSPSSYQRIWNWATDPPLATKGRALKTHMTSIGQSGVA